MRAVWARTLFLLKMLAIFMSGFALLACSGGESGTGNQPIEGDTVVGPINGFGSVIVNGIKFDTSGTSINIDGVSVSESNLSVGMVVKVTGEVNGTTGTASSISMEHEVKGLVLNVNLDTDGVGDINVMGQTIVINSDVQFESDVGSITTIDQLSAGNTVVKVSGYANGQGDVYATYLKAISNNGLSDEVKVKGVISNLAASSFDIGNIEITFDNATEFEDIPNNTLAEGMFVSVESDSASFDGSILSFYAEEIELLTFDENEGSQIEIEGIVTDDSNLVNNEFQLSGRTIKIDAGTRYEGGGPGDIANDVKLEVEGIVQTDGSVLADEIEFRNNSSIEISAYVDAKGADSITVLGQPVFVSETTSYEDDFAETWDFNFASIAIGDYVNLKLYVDPDDGSTLIANSIRKFEIQEKGQLSEVEAVVAAVNGSGSNTTLTLVGMPTLTVDLNGLQFTGGVGGEVEVRGNYNNDISPTLVATELDI